MTVLSRSKKAALGATTGKSIRGGPTSRVGRLTDFVPIGEVYSPHSNYTLRSSVLAERLSRSRPFGQTEVAECDLSGRRSDGDPPSRVALSHERLDECPYLGHACVSDTVTCTTN